MLMAGCANHQEVRSADPERDNARELASALEGQPPQRHTFGPWPQGRPGETGPLLWSGAALIGVAVLTVGVVLAVSAMAAMGKAI
jgi:hypothetical protein